MRLSPNDLRRILDSVNILTANIDPDTLPERTDSSVRYLISTDILSFEAFGTDNDYQGPLWYTPANSVPDDVLVLMAELVVEQPFYRDVIGRRLRGAVRITDYMPASKYKKLAVYNEFFRKINTDRQLSAGLHVSNKLMVTCSLCRLKTDFTREDCAKIDMLAPHLERAFQTAKFIRRIGSESRQLQSALELRKCAIVKLNADFQIFQLGVGAELILQKYFDFTLNILPSVLSRYIAHHVEKIRKDDFYFPPKPLDIMHESGQLRVSFSYDRISETCILYLDEFSRYHSSISVDCLLTPREKEVLHWVSAGKTDFQIGLLMCISTRTVQKHLENIYQKLGVETRTSAMAIFLGG